MVSHPLLPRNSRVFGVKKFFKFLQKEGFGADFHPSKRLPGGSESGFHLSPARFAPQNFLKILSSRTAPRTGFKKNRFKKDRFKKDSTAAPRSTEPSPKLTPSGISAAPPPPMPKTPASRNFWRQRKSPEANLGASVERLTRLELATSTLARWCSTN